MKRVRWGLRLAGHLVVQGCCCVLSAAQHSFVAPPVHRHFKGIPPRLVEIYRQRALTSHWSLAK